MVELRNDISLLQLSFQFWNAGICEPLYTA